MVDQIVQISFVLEEFLTAREQCNDLFWVFNLMMTLRHATLLKGPISKTNKNNCYLYVRTRTPELEIKSYTTHY